MVNLIFNDLAANNHYLLIKNTLQVRIKNILKNGASKNSTSYKPDPNLRIYLKSLLKDENLKPLIVARPDALPAIIAYMKRNFPNSLVKDEPENIILENLFIKSCYDKTTVFSKFNFIRNINIDTCPYCNRGYIYSLSQKNKIKPEIDHFFPKTIYPFLGLSYYNLIPSCSICNGLEVKSQNDPIKRGLVNPYLVLSSDFLFSYEPLSSTIISSLLDKNSIKIKLVNNISGHLKVFKLAELYQQHADHVLELIFKSKIQYSQTYRDYLKKFSENGLQFSENEIDRMLLGNYSAENEIHKRPLAKLYQDIGRELGLIK
jgi:hypothetical protein